MSAPILDEAWLKSHVWPRFSRALARKEIYLANHSLGRPPDRMVEDVRGAIDAWYRDLDGAWKLWLEGRERFRSLTAKLVGAPRADCIIPKASAGQGLRAVLNALPGKPGACWLYVRPGLVDSMRTPDTGWFAKKDVFSYARPEPPEFGPGGDAWLESTPPVLACFQALAGLELTLELGVERLRAYSMAQKQTFAELLPGIDGAGKHHGAFVTLKHRDAAALAIELEKQGVKLDARGEYLRLCPDILNPRAELERAAATLRALLEPNTTR